MTSIYFFFVILITTLTYSSSKKADYYSYSLENFREAKIFNEVIDVKNPDNAKINAVIFYLTNEIRVKKDLKILAYEKKLEESAALHSNSMVEYNFFEHTNPKSKQLRTPDDRARYVGIQNPMLAENIIKEFVLQYESNSPVYPGKKGEFSYKPGGDLIPPHTYLSLGEVLIKKWMNSPGHKKNIMSREAVQLGCGTAFYTDKKFNDMPCLYATQNFQLYANATTGP